MRYILRRSSSTSMQPVCHAFSSILNTPRAWVYRIAAMTKSPDLCQIQKRYLYQPASPTFANCILQVPSQHHENLPISDYNPVVKHIGEFSQHPSYARRHSRRDTLILRVVFDKPYVAKRLSSCGPPPRIEGKQLIDTACQHSTPAGMTRDVM